MTQEQESKPEVEETPQVSSEFAVAMFDELDTLTWPGSDGKYFITAKRCGLRDEDKIASSLMQFEAETAGGGKRRRQDAPVKMVGAIAVGRAFVEKCVHQIKGFRLPATDKDRHGELLAIERQWNPANEGDNPDNRAFYAFMADERLRFPVEKLRPEHVDIVSEELSGEFVTARDLVEGWLDLLQGRDTDAQADFERLGNALRASRTTT
ncbi:MAG: hypothetical protein PHZ19_10380 [Candidatus Thermoplasmatota archaeon]|nr:hypothetical protein [Candidatus Thermoplasmatota archaeon]